MPIGLRIGPSSVDLDVFLAFVRAQGGVELPPREQSAELHRFKVGRHFGSIAKRKDGRITFAGVARELYSRMTEQMRTQVQ